MKDFVCHTRDFEGLWSKNKRQTRILKSKVRLIFTFALKVSLCLQLRVVW